MRGARQAYAASTLWAAIIGKRSPNSDDDRALDPGQRRRQDDVLGHVDAVAGEVVVPVDAPQVPRRRAPAGRRHRRATWSIVVGSASSANVGRTMPRSTEAFDAVGQGVVVDDAVGEAELVLERVQVGTGGVDHGDILPISGPSLPQGPSCSDRRGCRARRTAAPPVCQALRTFVTACLPCIHGATGHVRHAIRPGPAQEVDARVVLGVATRRRLQLVVGTDR